MHQGSQKIRQKSVKKSVENKKQSLGSPVENPQPVLGARATCVKSLVDSSSKDSSNKANGSSDSKDTSEDPSEEYKDSVKYPCGDKSDLPNRNSQTAVKVDKIDFIAECYYKTVTFSPEDFQKRLQQFNLGSSNPSDLCNKTISSQNTGSNSVHPTNPTYTQPKSTYIANQDTSGPDQDLHSLSSSPSHQSSLMLSAAERQELAENAMEQLASGLNKAAEAMQSGEEEEVVGEVKPDLANLQDKELFQLLEEAYSYKSKKDRQGKSEMFRELLEKAEENSSGEEQWDINFRKHLHHQDSTGKKKKKKVSESSKKGGSLSNLSCLSDFESSSSGRSGKNKKCRSSVSSRSREGGSLPPTKFENVMLFEGGSNAPPPPSSFAWDTGGKVMPGESGLLDGVVTPGELQPLLHSTSDSMLRKLVASNTETCIDMENVANGECDTDSNKTEVEEIEMVDMEGRDMDTAEQADDETTPLLQARHRMETRGRVIGNHGPEEGIELQSGWSSVRSVTEGAHEREVENKPEMDENGNPTTYTNGGSNGPFPIMDPQLRPLSIYRHTPVFRPQKLTVPSMQPEHNHSEDKSKVEGKRKVRRKKEEEKNVVKAEDIEGYRGNKDIDSILEFIDGENGGKKKKSGDKLLEKNKKNNAKSDIKDDKVRKKKEKSLEKDNINKPSVTKKLSVDNIDNDVIEEDPEIDQEDRGISVETDNTTRPSVSPEKDSTFPVPALEVDVKGAESMKSPVVTIDTIASVKPSPSLASSGRANSAPSNDSGHVSAEPCSLPSVSSTKEMSIASSPPLDLDHVEFVSEESCSQETTNTEFTKVTKKQRKKKGGSIRERPDRMYQSGSAFSEENRSRGGDDEGRVASSTRRSQLARGSTQGEGEEWSFRGYNRIRGSREAVTGAKSTCSVPPSDASDTDDHDSVHSLPVGSTRKKVSAPTHSVSSGHTPQASYADIARHAAALYTQQAGQQQHAVYREQLQFRDTTPSNTKESVSSTEGDSMSFSYCPPDLDSTFPPVPPPPHPIPGYTVSIVSPPHGHLARAASEPSDSVYHVEPENNNTNSFLDVKTNNASHDNSNPAPKLEEKITENKISEEHNPGSKVAKSSQSTIKQSSAEVKQSSPEVNLPPVVILNSSRDNLETEGGFTFGFEVNESLLAMSCAEKCQISDKISENCDTSDAIKEKVGKRDSFDTAPENIAHQKPVKSIEDSPSVVNNQNFEDNEMMKNLLSCTKKSQDSYTDRPSEPSENVMVNEEPNVNTFDEDDVDVVVESQSFDDTKGLGNSTYDFTAFCRDIETTDHRNFNYDVIVSFVKQAWDVVSKELKTGSPVIYYSS
eukprot:GFUD01031168.1.p1 GENE.GFUD01031168.1~~GFUD01031168.1.p1  ORF type:complete len:1328 (+),score=372.05 GFUD01031168.1:241-4224(+)